MHWKNENICIPCFISIDCAEKIVYRVYTICMNRLVELTMLLDWDASWSSNESLFLLLISYLLRREPNALAGFFSKGFDTWLAIGIEKRSGPAFSFPMYCTKINAWLTFHQYLQHDYQNARLTRHSQTLPCEIHFCCPRSRDRCCFSISTWLVSRDCWEWRWATSWAVRLIHPSVAHWSSWGMDPVQKRSSNQLQDLFEQRGE